MPAPKQRGHQAKSSISKFVNKRPTFDKTKREKNQYQFRGFYDRLRTLDVKQSHSMGQNFDNLVDENANDLIRDMDTGEEQMKSNFIEYLRTEKLNNRTLDFKKVFNDLEPLCYSHALILLNKKKIVTKLTGYLKFKKSSQEADA